MTEYQFKYLKLGDRLIHTKYKELVVRYIGVCEYSVLGEKAYKLELAKDWYDKEIGATRKQGEVMNIPISQIKQYYNPTKPVVMVHLARINQIEIE